MKNEAIKDLTGQVFGELTVLGISERRISNRLSWLCRCSCGKETVYPTYALIRGASTHCRNCRWGSESKDVRMERHLFRRYINSAKKRNIQFSLTEQEFYAIIRKPCRYCGKFRCSRNEHTKEVHTKFNGVDRLDNSKGYTTENSVPCCSYCNQAKNNRNEEEFLSWAKELYEYQKGK